MTEVTFHFNVADRLGYACSLVRSIAGKGRSIVVTAEPGLLQELDVALWTFEPLSFLPHCLAERSPPSVVAASPVLLAARAAGWPHQDVLLNLGPQVPDGFERFERLVDLVTLDEEDRAGGRLRTRHYRSRGYPVRHYDVQTRELR